MVECTFPCLEELLDVSSLSVGELEPVHEPPHLPRIVVLDRGLEAFAERRRLPELPAEPPPEADLGCFHMGGAGLEPATPCV